MGKGRGANPGTLTERWPPRRLATHRARGAAQVAPRSGREFESRSRKRLEPPATPAHDWPLCGPRLVPLRAPDFGGPQNAHGSPALRRKWPQNGAQAAAGGREGLREGKREGAREGRTRNVSSGWRLSWRLRSSNWRLSGGPGNLPGQASELGLGLEAAVRVAND